MIKFFVMISFVVLLFGCDNEGEAVLLKSEGNTAIYLPGGVGLDFGKPPLVNRVEENKNGRFAKVVIELSEDDKEIDSAINKILSESGFLREEQPSQQGYQLVVRYVLKGGAVVVVRYRVLVKQGLQKYTEVMFTWSV